MILPFFALVAIRPLWDDKREYHAKQDFAALFPVHGCDLKVASRCEINKIDEERQATKNRPGAKHNSRAVGDR